MGLHYRERLKGTPLGFKTMLPLVISSSADSAEWRSSKQGWVEG